MPIIYQLYFNFDPVLTVGLRWCLRLKLGYVTVTVICMIILEDNQFY